MVKCTTNEEKQAEKPGSAESPEGAGLPFGIGSHEEFMRNHLKRIIAMTDFLRSVGPGTGLLLGLAIKAKLAEAEAANESTLAVIFRLAQIGFNSSVLPLLDSDKITAAAEAVAGEFGTVGDIQFRFGKEAGKGEGAGDEK